MGHVWLARDERSGLDVALKMVAREGKVAERAEREARAAAALRHPRCQRIYALARDPSHIYIAYEYVPGRTMRQALAAGELGDREAVETAAQVLEALAHAHGRGIVHRDVKPSNVLLGEGGGVDVRLLDFGLAQMAEFDTLTAIGDVPGTLAYVAPERLLGQTATAAADVWAVGVMLWEALAGRHPFRTESGPETSRRIQAGAPRLETVRPDLPASLRDAIDQALVLNPARRPSAGKLAEDLRTPTRKRRRSSGGDQTTVKRPRMLTETRVADVLRARVLPAGAAALWTGWVTTALPFYPSSWTLGLTALAGLIGMALPRAAIAVALTATFFPLANISIGLALVFAVFAVAWTAFTWNDPRGNAILVAGPLLGPLAGLGLLPIVAQLARGKVRRGVQAAVAVLVAAVVAGLRHERLPFDGSLPPLGLGITGSSKPGAVAFALWRQLEAHPIVIAEAGIVGGGRAPRLLSGERGAVERGRSAAPRLNSTRSAPRAAFIPLVAAAWITAAILLQPARRGRLDRPSEVGMLWWQSEYWGVTACSEGHGGESPQRSAESSEPVRPTRPLDAEGQPTGTDIRAAASTRERSGPTTKRCSRLRRCDTLPTFSPAGLWCRSGRRRSACCRCRSAPRGRARPAARAAPACRGSPRR